ncbi:hypothetical protein ACFSYD_13185 [Paracoccus aerius]
MGPLIGGYPAVYGLVGAFTFLLWSRLGAVHANRMRAFTLIGMLLAFQLVFGIVFGGAGYGWIAEIAGFERAFFSASCWWTGACNGCCARSGRASRAGPPPSGPTADRPASRS